MFVARGYADVNIADVADAVGVGKGTVYRHFASKEELFRAAAAAAVRGVGRGRGRGVRGARLARQRPARGRRREAEWLLAAVIEPELPLLLDFVNRALRREPGRAEEARTLFGSLAARRAHALGAAVRRMPTAR